jgi:ubiquinone biosynthesis protein UbiJ
MERQVEAAVADSPSCEDWQTAALELRTAVTDAVALIDQLEDRVEALEKRVPGPTYATWADAMAAGIPLG